MKSKRTQLSVRRLSRTPAIRIVAKDRGTLTNLQMHGRPIDSRKDLANYYMCFTCGNTYAQCVCGVRCPHHPQVKLTEVHIPEAVGLCVACEVIYDLMTLQPIKSNVPDGGLGYMWRHRNTP